MNINNIHKYYGLKINLKNIKNHNNVKERFAHNGNRRFANAIRQHRTLTGVNFVRLACKKHLSSYKNSKKNGSMRMFL